MSGRRPLSIIFLIFFILILLSSCSKTPIKDGPPDREVDLAAIPDAVPRIEPRTRAGNPDHYKVLGKRYHVLKDSKGYAERGIASWYGSKFHGRKTSNGEAYDMFAMTAAHRTLPIPSYARVTNLRNNRSVIVRINDRGPFHENRIIDLSYVAAAKLGLHRTGTGFVEVRAIEPERPTKPIKKVATASAKNKIYLQIGAFASRHNALRLEKSIKDFAHLPATRIQASKQQEASIYRVQLGPIASVEEADRVSERLNELGIMNTQFIIEAAGIKHSMVE